MDTTYATSLGQVLTFNGEDYMTCAFKLKEWIEWRCLWRIFEEDAPTEYEGEENELKWRTENGQGYSTATALKEYELATLMEYKDMQNLPKNALRNRTCTGSRCRIGLSDYG